MAREASITQHDVNAIADQLRAAGSKPTARAVRDALGRGSMATVLRLLQVWQGGAATSEAAPMQLPPALQRTLLETIAQEVAAARVKLEEALAEAKQTQLDLIRENEAQQTDLERLNEALEKALSERDQLAGRLEQAERELIQSQARAERLREEGERARTEQAKAELRLEGVPRLEKEVEHLRVLLDAERQDRTAAQQAAAVAEARMVQMEAWLAETRQRLGDLETVRGN